jgi:hypothetical protein
VGIRLGIARVEGDGLGAFACVSALFRLDTVVFDGLIFDGLIFDGLIFDGLIFDGLIFDGLIFDGLAFGIGALRLLDPVFGMGGLTVGEAIPEMVEARVRVNGLGGAELTGVDARAEFELDLGLAEGFSAGVEKAIDKLRTRVFEGVTAGCGGGGTDFGRNAVNILVLRMLAVRLIGAGFGGEEESSSVCLMFSTEGAGVGSLCGNPPEV